MKNGFLRKQRNQYCARLYFSSGMSYRDFADFWNMDHSQVARVVKKYLKEKGIGGKEEKNGN